MADFDLTQTDQQVQNILNDAQGAMGASAQTTLTTEYVMLKDTNGVYHKILKSSFTEAIRDVLAGLLVNNDKGTTINQIAAIASGDFGSITPANLASVLGAWLTGGMATNLTSGQDIFALPGGSFIASTAVNSSLTNRPSTMSTSHTCRILVMQQINTNNYKTILTLCEAKIFVAYVYTSNGNLMSDGWKQISMTNVA